MGIMIIQLTYGSYRNSIIDDRYIASISSTKKDIRSSMKDISSSMKDIS